MMNIQKSTDPLILYALYDEAFQFKKFKINLLTLNLYIYLPTWEIGVNTLILNEVVTVTEWWCDDLLSNSGSRGVKHLSPSS